MTADIILNFIGKIYEIFRYKSENKKSLFKELIDPLFVEMTTIHKDYIESFEVLRKTIQRKRLSSAEIRELIKEKQATLKLVREKTYHLSYSLTLLKSKTLRKRPESVIAFAEACLEYFRVDIFDKDVLLKIDYNQKLRPIDCHRDSMFRDPQKYRGGYTTLFAKFLDDGYFSLLGKDDVVDRISDFINSIENKWSDISIAYSHSKVDLY